MAQRERESLRCRGCRETQVQLLGPEGPLEKDTATHSRIIVWRSPWTEEPGGLSPGGCREQGPAEVTWSARELCRSADSAIPQLKKT